MVELGRYICTSLISMNNVHFFADLYWLGFIFVLNSTDLVLYFAADKEDA
jgi:hypothetical protein